MGTLHLKIDDTPEHINTAKKLVKEIEEERILYILDRIAESSILKIGNKVCYVYGMGGQPKTTYLNFLSVSGAEVVFYEKFTINDNFFFKLLSKILVNYQGLVKILNPKALKEIFLKLSEQAMVGLYIFDKKYEESFLKKARSTNIIGRVEYELKNDPEFFIYTVDGDNGESSTGMLEIIHYGKECPKEIRDIAELAFL